MIGSVPMRSVDTGETIDFPVFKNGSFERHPCTKPSCTDGIQQRRIVSATLETPRGIYDRRMLVPDSILASLVELEKENPYLILAHHEAVE